MKPPVATRNPRKLVELGRILRAVGIDSVEFFSLSDVPEYPGRPETGRTFTDNAYIKVFDGVTHTGHTCSTDDLGLSVGELSGMLGVFSVRWSGTHGDDVADYELLFAQMGDCPDERRAVSFRTACTSIVPDVKGVPSVLVDGDFPAILGKTGNLLLAVEGR